MVELEYLCQKKTRLLCKSYPGGLSLPTERKIMVREDEAESLLKRRNGHLPMFRKKQQERKRHEQPEIKSEEI